MGYRGGHSSYWGPGDGKVLVWIALHVHIGDITTDDELRLTFLPQLCQRESGGSVFVTSVMLSVWIVVV